MRLLERSETERQRSSRNRNQSRLSHVHSTAAAERIAPNPPSGSAYNPGLCLMRYIFAAITLLALIPSPGYGCSLYMSPEFHIRTARHAAKPLQVGVRDVNFVPWISGSGTCDGVGFITIKLSGLSARDIKTYGVFIRAKTGVSDKEQFPSYPLAPTRTDRDGTFVTWAWTDISPDADGHVRWTLEIVPVSRSGVLAAPVSICVASDDSCPKLAGDPV